MLHKHPRQGQQFHAERTIRFTISSKQADEIKSTGAELKCPHSSSIRYRTYEQVTGTIFAVLPAKQCTDDYPCAIKVQLSISS